MRRYVVFAIDDNEDAWETASDETKQATYDHDYRFGSLLQARGGRIVGGAGLGHSRDMRVLRKGTADAALVTDGPYAGTAEQVSGFFIVECEDLDVLTEACREMLPAHVRLEIRLAASPES